MTAGERFNWWGVAFALVAAVLVKAADLAVPVTLFLEFYIAFTGIGAMLNAVEKRLDKREIESG